MTTEPMLDFIKSQLQLGVSREAITNMLIGQEWAMVDINEAFATINGVQKPAPAIAQAPQPAVTSPLAQPTQSAPIQQPVQKHSHWLAITVIILAIACLGAAGTFAYYKFLAPVVSSILPLDILKNSLHVTLGQTDSFSFVATTTGQSTVKIGKDQSYSANFTLAGSGSLDIHSPSNPLVV